MERVYKYEIHFETKIELPIYTKVLSVQAQGNSVMLYVLHTDSEEKEIRTFKGLMTNEDFDASNHQYCGTAMLQNGIVVHVFEDLNIKEESKEEIN